MSLPAFLHFDPVPVRGRRDGWTPELQRHFILLIGCGSTPAEAARRLGRSRQTAYALRQRPGGRSFAAAWDAAWAFSCQARAPGTGLPRLEYGLETLLVPRFYRGRLVGFAQREDRMEALRTLQRLDRMASALETRGVTCFADLAERAAALQIGEGAAGVAHPPKRAAPRKPGELMDCFEELAEWAARECGETQAGSEQSRDRLNPAGARPSEADKADAISHK